MKMVTVAMKLKDTYFLEKSYDQPRQHIKKQRHYFANKGPSSQGYGGVFLFVCLFLFFYFFFFIHLFLLGRMGMGNTCNSMDDSCQCMTKPLQIVK